MATPRLVKLSALHIGKTAPASPYVGKRWIDTTSQPLVERVWTGDAWVAVIAGADTESIVRVTNPPIQRSYKVHSRKVDGNFRRIYIQVGDETRATVEGERDSQDAQADKHDSDAIRLRAMRVARQKLLDLAGTGEFVELEE